MNKVWTLNQDVYLVNGHARSCIYDIKKGQLYSVSQKTAEIITRLVNTDIAIPQAPEEDQVIINTLVNRHILISVNKADAAVHSIQDLKQHYPIQFCWIEVTRKCNLKCTFCYEESSPECTEKMSLNDFLIVRDNLKSIGVKNIQFIGGEPMILGRDLKKMIQACANDFSFIEVYTNGVFIDKHWARFFKKYNIKVALSVHSYDAAQHDALTTVKGSHRKVERAIALLREYQVPFRVGSVETKSCDIGCKKDSQDYTITPDPVRLTGRGSFNQYTYEMFLKKAITKSKKRHPINKHQVSMYISGHQCFLKDLYIGAKLEVYPCVMERRFTYGNLKKDQLADIMNNDVRLLSKDRIDGCRDCEYRYACFDCRPDSNGLGKFQKPWFCSYDPYMGEWADLTDMFQNLQNGMYHTSVYKSQQSPTVPALH